jgi:hypothetical protein
MSSGRPRPAETGHLGQGCVDLVVLVHGVAHIPCVQPARMNNHTYARLLAATAVLGRVLQCAAHEAAAACQSEGLAQLKLAA